MTCREAKQLSRTVHIPSKSPTSILIIILKYLTIHPRTSALDKIHYSRRHNRPTPSNTITKGVAVTKESINRQQSAALGKKLLPWGSKKSDSGNLYLLLRKNSRLGLQKTHFNLTRDFHKLRNAVGRIRRPLYKSGPCGVEKSSLSVDRSQIHRS